jgi:DNA-binding CsgD family transcriptional regulator
LRAFSAALERLYTPVPLEDFPRLLMETVDSVVHCGTLAFNEVNLTTCEVRTQFKGEVCDDVMESWAYFAHEHPGIAYVAAGGTERVFAVTDFITQRQFRNTGLYENVFKPVAAEAQLVAVVPMGGRAAGLSLNRDDSFSARDKLLVELIQPHIARAYFNAQVLSAARQPKSAEPDFLAWRRLGLTRRECEVLRWVAEGKRDGEIAVVLDLSCRTVNHHVGNIMRKLHVETRTTAVARALELLR